ncbi:Transcriptional regulator HosA (plasmid) [Pantoea sp. Nvir]|uniref:MarR family winged helix-turn-helix transcriptional regulator n=1 Tax=Pantoea sp. Nvir TaxID=2576760 RepID=UPI0030D0C1D7
MNKNLTNVPFHLMRRLFLEHTSQWQQSLSELTKPQYAVLCAVDEQPGIEQMDLMEVSVSTKATLAELLLRMEKKGLVRREQGTYDRRRRHIYLTDAGKKVLEEAKPAAGRVDAAFLNRLSEQEQQELIRLLQKMLG